MRQAPDIPWPPPINEPYQVEDAFGSFTEIVMPGAYTGAREIDGDRTFKVAVDEWSDNYTVRHIKSFEAISVIHGE